MKVRHPANSSAAPLPTALSGMSEDQLVARITRALPTCPEVRVGVGDDCAVIGGVRDKVWQLLKTDAVVESIHFLPGEEPERVGWKALCRAISDIGAMGGTPDHALVTLAAAPSVAVAYIDGIYMGLKRAARKFGVTIVGGETSRSPGPLFLSITLTGHVERSRCALRSGGKPGDAIFVTGRLGGSFASGKHLDFTPRVREARWLTEATRVRAMMDLSDGLSSDLPRLARASGCGFDLWHGKVPVTRGCSLDAALGDGEDFELLFTVPGAAIQKLSMAWTSQFPRLPLTQVGTLTPLNSDRTQTSLHTRGFDHFSQSR